jgi:hypothetical protein
MAGLQLIITSVLLETAALPLLGLIYDHKISYQELKQNLTTAAENRNRLIANIDNTPSFHQDHILHPYLGFVRNPQQPQQLFNGAPAPLPVNEYGFFGATPFEDQRPERFVVAITGGSVATDLVLQARAVIAQELAGQPQLAGRPVDIISIAVDGMKQPQQLMVLNYFLMLGAKFDVVVNLSGFTEVALPLAENYAQGVAAFFPRSWPIYAAKSLDLENAALIGRIQYDKDRLEVWRALLANSIILRNSRYMLAFWQILQDRFRNRQLMLEQKLNERQTSRALRRPQETGPAAGAQSAEQLLHETALLWQRASVQMWQLCSAADIAYLHVLLPNQYVPGTKPLSAWEQQHVIIDRSSPYRRAVEQGYPLLRRAGIELLERSVPFVDLTELFHDDSRTLYKDICCHLNRTGNEQLAKAVAAAIIDLLPGEGPPVRSDELRRSDDEAAVD